MECIKLMNSYLSHRTQCVKIGNNISKHACITRRVPGESVLEPLLFLIFINDIHISDSEVSFHLLLNKTSLFFADKNIKKLEK